MIDRAKYQSFIFEDYSYTFSPETSDLTIFLRYSFDGIEKFEEKFGLKVTPEQWSQVNMKAFEKALQAFYMIGGISYYKALCTPKIIQQKVPMNADQAAFWQKLYERGLGEFFYQNQLDFRGLIKFQPNDLPQTQAVSVDLSSRALLPLGGGKDSIVSAEILKKNGLDFINFSLRDADPIRKTAEVIGKDRIVISRQIAPRLIELNNEGALNGHVPITGFISFLLVICAIVYDYKYLIFSLEKSANFGQLEFFGMDINHQYSKSEEFEGDFRKYVQQYICPEVDFFSLLRGFYELKIVELFTSLKNLDSYLPVFTSCNANFKLVKEKSPTLWCGHCPKCAFVFLCLAVFLDRDKLIKVFGKNMFEDADLMDLFEELLGVKNFKPFECVGTIEECRAAIWAISQKPEYANDFIVKQVAEKYLPKWRNLESELKRLLQIQPGHFIPDFLLETINSWQKS